MPRFGTRRALTILCTVLCTASFLWYVVLPAQTSADQTRAIGIVENALKTLEKSPDMALPQNLKTKHGSPNHLVIVPGHAIWKGGSWQGRADSEWYVYPRAHQTLLVFRMFR